MRLLSPLHSPTVAVAAAATSYVYPGWRPLHYLARDDSLSLYRSPVLFSVSTLPALRHRQLSREGLSHSPCTALSLPPSSSRHWPPGPYSNATVFHCLGQAPPLPRHGHAAESHSVLILTPTTSLTHSCTAAATKPAYGHQGLLNRILLLQTLVLSLLWCLITVAAATMPAPGQQGQLPQQYTVPYPGTPSARPTSAHYLQHVALHCHFGYSTVGLDTLCGPCYFALPHCEY